MTLPRSSQELCSSNGGGEQQSRLRSPGPIRSPAIIPVLGRLICYRPRILIFLWWALCPARPSAVPLRPDKGPAIKETRSKDKGDPRRGLLACMLGLCACVWTDTVLDDDDGACCRRRRSVSPLGASGMWNAGNTMPLRRTYAPRTLLIVSEPTRSAATLDGRLHSSSCHNSVA